MVFVCRILVNQQLGGSAVVQSRPMGVRYGQGGDNPSNSILYVILFFDLQFYQTVALETEFLFSTSSDGASVTTTGRLKFYLYNY